MELKAFHQFDKKKQILEIVGWFFSLEISELKKCRKRETNIKNYGFEGFRSEIDWISRLEEEMFSDFINFNWISSVKNTSENFETETFFLCYFFTF